MIAFLNSGMMPTGRDQIMVRIHHRRDEGYPLSADGHEIKEEMPLQEFLRRIFKDEKYVEIELYRVSKCIGYGSYGQGAEELSKCAEVYNKMYIDEFRKNRSVLAQHTMRGIGSHGMLGGIDPYNDQRQQMAQMTAMDYHQRAMLRETAFIAPPSRGILDNGPTHKEMIKQKEAEIAKKRSDDLFFLTT